MARGSWQKALKFLTYSATVTNKNTSLIPIRSFPLVNMARRVTFGCWSRRRPLTIEISSLNFKAVDSLSGLHRNLKKNILFYTKKTSKSGAYTVLLGYALVHLNRVPFVPVFVKFWKIFSRKAVAVVVMLVRTRWIAFTSARPLYSKLSWEKMFSSSTPFARATQSIAKIKNFSISNFF